MDSRLFTEAAAQYLWARRMDTEMRYRPTRAHQAHPRRQPVSKPATADKTHVQYCSPNLWARRVGAEMPYRPTRVHQETSPLTNLCPSPAPTDKSMSVFQNKKSPLGKTAVHYSWTRRMDTEMHYRPTRAHQVHPHGQTDVLPQLPQANLCPVLYPQKISLLR